MQLTQPGQMDLTIDPSYLVQDAFLEVPADRDRQSHWARETTPQGPSVSHPVGPVIDKPDGAYPRTGFDGNTVKTLSLWNIIVLDPGQAVDMQNPLSSIAESGPNDNVLVMQPVPRRALSEVLCERASWVARHAYNHLPTSALSPGLNDLPAPDGDQWPLVRSPADAIFSSNSGLPDAQYSNQTSEIGQPPHPSMQIAHHDVMALIPANSSDVDLQTISGQPTTPRPLHCPSPTDLGLPEPEDSAPVRPDGAAVSGERKLDWDGMTPILIDLFKIKKMPLARVMDTMANEYDFRATKSQFTKQFSKRGIWRTKKGRQPALS